MSYLISREIGIDAGHRVPTHGSKCKNLHGHRYKIQAWCTSSELQLTGEQKDMTLDFGFLKDEMMDVIVVSCDHGLVLYECDELLLHFIPDQGHRIKVAESTLKSGWCDVPREWLTSGAEKLYVIPGIPTAEVLAKHWFERLYDRVSERSSRLAVLEAVKVYETPNCFAVYSPRPSEVFHEGR